VGAFDPDPVQVVAMLSTPVRMLAPRGKHFPLPAFKNATCKLCLSPSHDNVTCPRATHCGFKERTLSAAAPAVAAAHALREEAKTVLDGGSCKYIFLSYWEPPIMLLPPPPNRVNDSAGAHLPDAIAAVVDGVPMQSLSPCSSSSFLPCSRVARSSPLFGQVVQAFAEGLMWTATEDATLALLQIYECEGQLVSSDCVGKAAHCDHVDRVQQRFGDIARTSTSDALTVQIVSMPLVFSTVLEGIGSAMDLSVFLSVSPRLQPARQCALALCVAGAQVEKERVRLSSQLAAPLRHLALYGLFRALAHPRRA
jgi:hypothetical protein